MKSAFVFVLYFTKRRRLEIKPQLEVEIEDGRDAPKKSSILILSLKKNSQFGMYSFTGGGGDIISNFTLFFTFFYPSSFLSFPRLYYHIIRNSIEFMNNNILTSRILIS